MFSGVREDPIVGPLLFLIHINGLLNSLTISDYLLSVDDSDLLKADGNIQTL